MFEVCFTYVCDFVNKGLFTCDINQIYLKKKWIFSRRLSCNFFITETSWKIAYFLTNILQIYLNFFFGHKYITNEGSKHGTKWLEIAHRCYCSIFSCDLFETCQRYVLVIFFENFLTDVWIPRFLKQTKSKYSTVYVDTELFVVITHSIC